MGFFSKAAVDPLEKMKRLADAKPKDTKLRLELASALKAKGSVTAAAEHYLLAASLMYDEGFVPKAVAIARQVTHLVPKQTKAYELLVKCYENAKLHEDKRGVLKTLVELYTGEGRRDAADAAQAQINGLGPAR